MENSDSTHYPELYSQGCCGWLLCGICPATTAFVCGSSGPCLGCCGVNGAFKIGAVKNMMKPTDDKTDYTGCAQVCIMHTCCGCCELAQLANVADIRKAAGHPVVTPISNPMQMQMMQQMQQMQMNQLAMNQAAAPAAPQ
jgi:hypothetical protein